PPPGNATSSFDDRISAANKTMSSQDEKCCCLCPPPGWNHASKPKRYACRSFCAALVVWFLLIAISIIDLLPVMMADPEALYVLHGVDISDLCDASNVPYSVLVDFDLPFHGELVHVNKMSLKVSVNDNPNQKRGHVDKNLLVSSDFQPLFKKSDGSSSNVLGGGESSLDFSDAAKLHDLAAAGKLATDQMNMYDLQVIVDLNVPIFTGRFMIPIWYTTDVQMFYTCGFPTEDSHGKPCPEEWPATKKEALCEYTCQYDDYPLRPMSYWFPELYTADRGIDDENIILNPDLTPKCNANKPARRRTAEAAPMGNSAEGASYLSSFDESDPLYALQQQWEEYNYW
ncbi:hypothetical protein TeGR_g10925, partial [Tetraparma gracilis]